MGFFKKNLLKVIECKDIPRDVMAYRYNLDDRYEIMSGSKLVVNEGQVAVFVAQGQIADIFPAGTYELDTRNIPILTKIFSWKYAFESPYKGDIYYVTTRQFTDVKWGTSNPIMMRDKDFGVIRLRGYGSFSFKVRQPDVFMREVFGTIHKFTVNEISDYLKAIVIQVLTDLLGECKIPALDLAANYLELGDTTTNLAKKKFADLGFDISDVVIGNLSLPPEVEKALDQRSTLGILGDSMSQFTQYQAANAMREAANNPSGMANTGVGLGAGVALGGMMNNMFAQSQQQAARVEADKEADPTYKCRNCGAKIMKGVKFCPECGEKSFEAAATAPTVKCPHCGAEVKATAKFCPECGEGMSYNCTKCGAIIKGQMKFCPECGNKLN